MLSLPIIISLVCTLMIVVHSVDPSNPTLPQCGQTCTGPQDCAGSNCSSCRLGLCVDKGNCGSYCNPNQSIDFWCYNDYCTYCDKVTNSCKSNCGGPCTSAGQCTQNCPKCMDYKCSTASGCTAPCANNNDCAANTDGCTLCIANVCTKAHGCSSYCVANGDCVQNTDGCTKCVRNQCIKGGCGSLCYYLPDCIGQGNCTQCMGRFPGGGGVCTSGCGLPCFGSDQCNGSLTNCGLCNNGSCAPSDVCGISCMNIVGCGGNCHRCIGGVCSANAKCGEACEVNTECDQSDPKCMYCINSKCGSPEEYT